MDRQGTFVLVETSKIETNFCEGLISFSSNARNGQFSGHEIAELYLKDKVSPSSKSIAVAIIQQGFEPSSFIGFFDQWNHKMWNVSTLVTALGFV